MGTGKDRDPLLGNKESSVINEENDTNIKNSSKVESKTESKKENKTEVLNKRPENLNETNPNLNLGLIPGQAAATSSALNRKVALTFGPRVLLVSDRKSFQENVSLVLRMNGISIVTANEAFWGMNLLENTQPPISLVLIDSEVKNMSGLEMISLIRYKYPKSDLAILQIIKDSQREDIQIQMQDHPDCMADTFLATDNPNIILKKIKSLLDTVLPSTKK